MDNTDHHEMAASTHVARPRRDNGSTFIEILVSVVLLGTAGIAVLTATTAAIVGARTNDEIAAAQAALAEAADYMTDTEPENVLYQSCGVPGVAAAYQAALDGKFGVDAVEVVGVRYWDRTSGDFGTTCRDSLGDRLQQVELRTLVNESARSVQVVKRPVAVPTIDTVPAPPIPPYAGGAGQATVSLNPRING